MEPFFSVVIPLYNKENYIEKTLRSVLAQSFSDFEILVVNDGSTDDSAKIVQKIDDPKISLIQQKNKGVSAARNHGIEKARGEYIALLDADDLWYPDHLEELHNLIARFPEAGLYCNSYEVYLGNGMTKKAVHGFAADGPQLVADYFSASLINPVAWTSAVGFSKTDFYTIGIFDTRLRTAQDLDFFIRAALKTPIAFHPEITMHYHKISENNLAKSHFNEDRIFLLRKHEQAAQKNPSLKKYLDINRFSIVLLGKLINDPRWKKLVPEIDPKNLNAKQRFLLQLPAPLLRLAIQFQRVLMKIGVYWTAFK